MATHILELRGQVGSDITASGVIAELERARGRRVLVRIDTGGGAFPSALAIVAALRAYAGQVDVLVLRGISAGFVIAHSVPVERRAIVADGVMLYHRGRTLVAGTTIELDTARRSLLEIDAKIRQIIGRSEDDLRPIEEQPLDAETCLRLGIVGTITAAAGRMRTPAHGRSRELQAIDELESIIADMLATRRSSARRGVVKTEAQLAATADPDLAARQAALDPPAGMPPVDLEDITAVQRVADGIIECDRRDIDLLEGARYRAQRIAAALRAGVVPPSLPPPHWHCAVCGEPNFHAHCIGHEPIPCAHCNSTIPSGEKP